MDTIRVSNTVVWIQTRPGLLFKSLWGIPSEWMSNSSHPDQAWFSPGMIWVKTVCNVYQQMTTVVPSVIRAECLAYRCTICTYNDKHSHLSPTSHMQEPCREHSQLSHMKYASSCIIRHVCAQTITVMYLDVNWLIWGISIFIQDNVWMFIFLWVTRFVIHLREKWKYNLPWRLWFLHIHKSITEIRPAS